MARQDKKVLKTYFETGDTPTEGQFSDAIDTFLDAGDLAMAFSGEIPALLKDDAEYLGTDTYESNGVGLYEFAPNGLYFDKTELKVSVVTNNTPATFNFYQADAEPTGNAIDLATYTLLGTVTQPVSNDIDTFEVLDLPTPIKVEAGKYLVIVMSTLQAVRERIKRWNSDNDGARARILFNSSFDHPNIFTTPWSAAGSPSFSVVPPKLSLTPVLGDPNAGNVNKNANNELEEVNLTNSVYKHPRGDAEYLGDNPYNPAQGAGIYHQAEFSQKVRTIKFPVFGVGYTGGLEVYKGSTLDPLPTAHTLVESFANGGFSLSDTAGVLSSVTLSSNLDLLEDEYLYLFLDGSGLTMELWGAQSGVTPLRDTQFIFKGGGIWKFSSAGFRYNTPIILEGDFVTQDNVVGIVAEQSAGKIDQYEPRINVPNQLYAVVGTEMSIYYDGVILGLDRGLESPLNVNVEVLCDVGQMQERRFRILPIASNVGTYPLTIRVWDFNGEIIQEKAVTLNVLAAAAPSAPNKNIIVIGDSLTADGTIATQVRDNFVAIGSNTPNFVGSVGAAPVQHEGRGGWEFEDFATQGSSYWRLDVTALVTPPVVGTVYAATGGNVRVAEVNIDGTNTGYIKVLRHSGTGTPPLPSGSLTKVSGVGQDPLPYTNGALEPANPFWNTATSQLDLANYKSNYGISGNIDLISMQLGINDNERYRYGTEAEIDAIVAHAQTFVDFIIAQEPTCKLMINLTTTDCNTKDAFASNYGATQPKEFHRRNVWRLREKLIESFDQGAYNVNVFINFISIDRYYGYPRTTSTSWLYSGYGVSYEYHSNARHPNSEGYQEIGNHIFAQMMNLL